MFLLGPLSRLFGTALKQTAKDLAKEAGKPPEPPETPVERVSEPGAIRQPPEPIAPVMRCNEAGIALIKSFEQCRLKAYDDGGGVWTIGWGHTKGVKRGDTCSQAEADEWFLEDLEEYEDGVRDLLGQTPTHPNEFSAFVALAYNIGLKGFERSTVLKRHRLGNKIGAANAFLMWRFVKGKEWPGLVRRREAERALYLG